jgi:hypothetical protein
MSSAAATPHAIPCGICQQLFFASSLPFHLRACKRRPEHCLISCPHCSEYKGRGQKIVQHIRSCKGNRTQDPDQQQARAASSDERKGLIFDSRAQRWSSLPYVAPAKPFLASWHKRWRRASFELRNAAKQARMVGTGVGEVKSKK